MTAADDLGDVIDQLTDRQPRKVSVLRRDSNGHAVRAISHDVRYDPLEANRARRGDAGRDRGSSS
jgi:hypothetical protein